jgi:hypothetical protein
MIAAHSLLVRVLLVLQLLSMNILGEDILVLIFAIFWLRWVGV